jgi:dethiobiotin synthase
VRGLFVTGTDTNVGKTAVSAALLHCCRLLGPVGYWKPIQTGAPHDDDTAVVRELGACGDAEICDAGIRLPRPLSPHLAAELCGRSIEMEAVLELAPRADDERYWIVEGAGGVLVPINRESLMIHLIAALRLPVVVAARAQLGTINHTLLTLEALRVRGIPVAGVVMVGERNPENRRAIETYGRVRIMGEMPQFDVLTRDALQKWASAGLDCECAGQPVGSQCR